MMMGSHDALFVGLSILIAILASYTALDLANRLRASAGRFRILWLSASALVLGGGIWAMHFVAMLAFNLPGLRVAYEPLPTILSLLLSIIFTGIGFQVIDHGGGLKKLCLAGCLMGLGIVAMHYVGMAAMKMDATLHYDGAWVGVSIIIAFGASVAGLALARRDQRGVKRVAASLVMGFAISGMHYAGMRAAIITVQPQADALTHDATFTQMGLAVAVTVLTLFILILGICAAAIDRRLSMAARREARITLRLRLADAMRDAGTNEALQETAALIGAHFGVSRVGYGEIRAEENVLDYRICWTDGTIPALLGIFQLNVVEGKILSALRAGETVVIEDVNESEMRIEPSSRERAFKLDTRGILVVPILHGKQLRNIFYLNSQHPRRWTDDEVRFMEEIAERARQVIARADAEKRLRELNETLEQRVRDEVTERRVLAAVVDNTSASILVCALNMTVLAVNKAQEVDFEKVFGKPCRVGDNLLDLLVTYPVRQDLIHRQWKRTFAGESFIIVDEFGDENHKRGHYEVHFHPMRDAVGVITGGYLISYDISERVRAERSLKAAQEALRQSQKMEAMGQLTGGVAHDFNNLLTPILGVLDMLQRRGSGNDRELRLIAGAYQSADRARILVQRLLAFARRQPLQPVPVDIGRLVAAMADLVTSTIGPQIKVAVDLPDNLPLARADPNQLEMALLNLSVNARDAMPDGGQLSISARANRLDQDSNELGAGRYITLSVADTGTGMDEATLRRAIEPFFSTKGVGKGTGLGLSMVHGLASQLGGALRINSQLGAGTTIELWLPQSDARQEPKEQAPHSSFVRRAGTVLLVDDEEQVRLTTANMLHELGYGVVEAASAEEAMTLIQSGETFDLLLTDHLMPGMTGTELVIQMRSTKPDMRALLISGYAETDGIESDIPRLAKPFRKDELATSLAEL